ncbi:hypothetical protein SteCoe_16519 [Stentor coeruleus]|uniref:Uncharacterized protein n=1 Tax=Stentor coeruleus TaxID=5963 RepID=A0A1R2C133_9CILI|nr:hypothetical protein SteCoe_16519 [Stentor coeruleus]
MEVTEQIINWLKQCNILKHGVTQSGNRYILNNIDTQGFESGLYFVPIIKRLSRILNYDSSPGGIPEINSLKDISSTAARLYNWNLIIKSFESFNIKIDSDMKALVVAGDSGVIFEILKSLYAAENHIQDSRNEPSRRKKKHKFLDEGAILLDELDINQRLTDCDSTLEFLILSFCQVFGLTTKVAAGLLAQSGKVLSQLLTKGLKGKYEPILSWYEKIIDFSEHLCDLIVRERLTGAVSMVLGAVKSGLMAKDYLVIQKCCECLVCINKYLIEKDVNTWEWFVIDGFALSLKAYDTFKEDVTFFIMKLLMSFGKDNLKDVFGQMMITNYPETVMCFNVISSFWGYLVEDTKAYFDIQAQGLIDYWVEFGLRQAETDDSGASNNRVQALGFLCDVWAKFSAYIEKHEDSANSILTVIKRACREKSRILKVICYGRLFYLLSVFSKQKNSYAAIIYKTLTFALVENFSNDRIREFILNNFLMSLEEIPSLPLNILLEPYIKQASISNKIKCNTSDFDFYVAIARHPKLTIKDAIIVIDFLGRIYYNDVIYSSSAELVIVLMVGRLIDNKAIQEFVLKFLNVGLKLIYSKISSKPRVPVRENVTREEIEEKKSFSYYKKLFFTIVEKIMQLRDYELNVEIAQMLLGAHMELKNITGSSLKIIRALLNTVGDAGSMIENYESGHMIVDVVRRSSSSIAPKSASLISEGNKGTVSVISGNTSKSRAMRDIERVKSSRIEKQKRDKSQSALRRANDERQKIKLKEVLEQKRVLHGVDSNISSSQAMIVKEAVFTVDFPLVIIEEETSEEQEIILILLRKYRRILKGLFSHYSNSGFKNNKFSLKAPFEALSEKKSSISESEISKMMREHGIGNQMLSTEDLRKVISWFYQKTKLPAIEFDYFPQLVYYISSFIYSKGKNTTYDYPLGISLMMLMKHFQESPAKVIPVYYFTEPDYGVGDKDVLKALNDKIKSNPDLSLPEGFIKVKEKDVVISYKVPKFFKPSHKAAVQILDDILFKNFQVHFLSPVTSVINLTFVKGVLNKPQMETQDKVGVRLGVPTNKAAYKIQPLPTYLNFTPGIKLEISNLSTVFSNDVLIECGRVVDDLIYSVDKGSFTVISRNPRPAGTISNKVIQQRTFEYEQDLADKQKHEAQRLLRKKIVEAELAKARSEKEKMLHEEEKNKKIDQEAEDLRKKKEKEAKMLQKIEIETKIKEYKNKKDIEESKKSQEEKQSQERKNEKKKKEREEFLKNEKKKILELLAEKTKKKQTDAISQELQIKSSAEKKINQRLLLMKKIQNSKQVVSKEKSDKEQISIAMSDPDVKKFLNEYLPGIETTFNYYCKQNPISATDATWLSMPGFNKFSTQFPIVPVLVTSDDILRIYKQIIKSKANQPGINIADFKESLVTITLISSDILKQESGKKIDSYSGLVKEFFKWIGLPKDSIETQNFLKKLGNSMQTLNPRDKKRQKNTLIRNLSEI